MWCHCLTVFHVSQLEAEQGPLVLQEPNLLFEGRLPFPLPGYSLLLILLPLITYLVTFVHDDIFVNNHVYVPEDVVVNPLMLQTDVALGVVASVWD